MLCKEELLEKYESLRKYWLEEAPSNLFNGSELDFMNQYNIDIESELINRSERYSAIKHIGNIIYNYKDYEKRINKFVNRLQDKWYRLWEKSFARIEKESCHWKREDFESREAYKEYLEDDIAYPYGWNSDAAYDALVIENILGDITKITNEHYELSF